MNNKSSLSLLIASYSIIYITNQNSKITITKRYDIYT